ncbi:unnamed protein product [Musa textilis]
MEDEVAEQTTMRGSDSPSGWPTLGKDRGLATTSGPHNCIVVRYQASRARCDNGKG